MVPCRPVKRYILRFRPEQLARLSFRLPAKFLWRQA